MCYLIMAHCFASRNNAMRSLDSSSFWIVIELLKTKDYVRLFVDVDMRIASIADFPKIYLVWKVRISAAKKFNGFIDRGQRR